MYMLLKFGKYVFLSYTEVFDGFVILLELHVTGRVFTGRIFTPMYLATYL